DVRVLAVARESPAVLEEHTEDDDGRRGARGLGERRHGEQDDRRRERGEKWSHAHLAALILLHPARRASDVKTPETRKGRRVWKSCARPVQGLWTRRQSQLFSIDSLSESPRLLDVSAASHRASLARGRTRRENRRRTVVARLTRKKGSSVTTIRFEEHIN